MGFRNQTIQIDTSGLIFCKNEFMIRDEKKYPQIQDENDLMEINRKIVQLGETYGK